MKEFGKQLGIKCSLIASGAIAALALKPNQVPTAAPEVIVTSVYDGDTFTVDIPSWPTIVGKKIGIRVNGIDCPELHDPNEHLRELSVLGKKFASNHLIGNKVKLLNISRDKYFRLDADVEVNGADLAKELIKEGLAKPYDGGTKIKWTEEDYTNYWAKHR